MSILTGAEIRRQIDAGTIYIEPFLESHLGANSYDLRLSSQLLVYDLSELQTLDMRRPAPVKKIEIPDAGYLLMPGTLYLGSTIERTKTDKFAPIIEGRSSVARLGITTHISAGYGDIGFDGHWTLEITAALPVIIYPNIRICQIAYFTVEGEIKSLYTGKYQHQALPEPSKIHVDHERERNKALKW